MHRHGMTIGEALIAAISTLALIAIGWGLFAGGGGVSHDRKLITKDGTQLCGIHQSWVLFSREFNGVFPTPGLISRLPFNGVSTPGRGEEDLTQNTTANIFAVCIMNNAFNSEICIGPTEPSGKVSKLQGGVNDYNYDAYNPALNRYWDESFAADLHKRSNVSYAHMPLFGDHKQNYWRDTLNANTPILGNRGPLGGVADPDSITNKIHKPHKHWSGHIVYNDNSVMFTTVFPTIVRS